MLDNLADNNESASKGIQCQPFFMGQTATGEFFEEHSLRGGSRRMQSEAPYIPSFIVSFGMSGVMASIAGLGAAALIVRWSGDR